MKELTASAKKHLVSSIKRDIEKKFPDKKGWIAAIDKETGDYVLGKTVISTYRKARKELKKETYNFVRVGNEAVYSFSGSTKEKK